MDEIKIEVADLMANKKSIYRYSPHPKMFGPSHLSKRFRGPTRRYSRAYGLPSRPPRCPPLSTPTLDAPIGVPVGIAFLGARGRARIDKLAFCF